MEAFPPLATRCFNISDVSKRETVCTGRICKGSPSSTTIGQRPQRFCFNLYASMSRLHLLRRPQADRSRPMLKTSAGHIVISSATVTRAGSQKASSSDLLLPGLIVLLMSFWTLMQQARCTVCAGNRSEDKFVACGLEKAIIRIASSVPKA